MACSTVSTRVVYQSIFVVLCTVSFFLHSNPEFGLEFIYDYKKLSTVLSAGYTTKGSDGTSFKVSLAYPNNVITAGIKHNSSDLAIDTYYDYLKGQCYFTCKSSHRTNPYIALSSHILVNDMNAIFKPYKKDLKREAYTKQLNKETASKQKNEFYQLKEIAHNTVHNLSENDPTRLEIEKIIKNLEVYYGQ
jgi:hypothetical protein